MMEQQVVRMGGVHQLAIMARQRFQPWVRGLDEDIGLVSCGAKHPLDTEDLMANRITIAERGQHLMHGRPENVHRRAPERGPEDRRPRLWTRRFPVGSPERTDP